MVIRDVMAVTQITSRIVFVPALKTYQIGLLMVTHKNGYFRCDFCNGAKAPRRSLTVESQISNRCLHYTATNSYPA